MSPNDTNTLVTTDWLAAHLNAPDVRILDASWYMPAENRNTREEYEAAHIPGARFFDIDEISDRKSPLPHMAPPVELFISRMRTMGIGDGHRVVVYDTAGLFSAARVWWLFRLFGKRDVAVLDGGFPKWRAEDRPVDDVAPVQRDRHFTARRDASLVRNAAQVDASSKLGDEQIVDARSPGRFSGKEPDPRPAMRAGHIPGSVNVFYKDLLNSDGTMKDNAGLLQVFAAAGVDLTRPVITSCGSGVTASIVSLALARIGHMQTSVYDGSWSEWGREGGPKVETG